MTSPEPAPEQVFTDAHTPPADADTPAVFAIAEAVHQYERHDGDSCTACLRVGMVAFAALRRHEQVGQQSDVEDVARWLAAQSGHARYSDGALGWRALIGQEHNVVHAHRAAKVALAMTAGQDADQARALDEARDALLRHARAEASHQ